MIGAFARILVGFVAACLAAGFTKVSFIIPPTSVFGAGDDVVSGFVTLSLLAATHIAVFSAAFALIAVAVGELQSQRSWMFYAAAGVAIALAGFIALLNSQAEGDPSIINNFALTAFLTAGFVGGLAYWLIAGRFAGSREEPDFAKPAPGQETDLVAASPAPERSTAV